jgi:integrase
MPPRRPLDDIETQKLLRAAAAHPRTGQRDHALISFALATGLRISEILSLSRADLVAAGGGLRSTVHVCAKNSKSRQARDIPISPRLHQILIAYALPLAAGGPLWPSWPYSRSSPSPLRYPAARKMLLDAARRAHIPGPIGWHSLRKCFAQKIYTHFLSAVQRGDQLLEPLRLTAKALGHRSIASTEHYLDHQADTVANAIRSL